MARGIPTVPESIEIIKEVLNALSVAHVNDLMHGAVSARNIFISQEKDVKVTDFILEPAVRINPSLLAQSTTADPSFMSPEQIKGEDITPTSDIYSTGVVFYQLLTGKLPFAHKGTLDLALNHIISEVAPPSRLNRSVPEYLDDIVLKMLEKDPLQRIGSAADVLQSLEQKRLVFRLPSQEYLDIVYDNSEPLIYDESLERAKKTAPAPKKTRKFNIRMLVLLIILIAIASGLWYAFFLNLLNTKD